MMWAAAGGDTHEEKEEAVCFGCEMYATKPTDGGGPSGFSDEEIEEFVDEIADIVRWEDAGFATDWSAYDLATKQLAVVWREAESDVRLLQTRRLQSFLRGWFKS